MTISITRIPSMLSLFLILMVLGNKVHSLRDVTSFHIDSFSPYSKDLTYELDAFIPSGSSHLQLARIETPGNHSVGRVLYSSPVNFWEQGRQASFETTIRLLISKVDNNPADGMTFFIVPVSSTMPTGGQGGGLGIYGALVPDSPFFAVEFDVSTYQPTDPRFRHIGININSRTSANVTDFEDAIGQFMTVCISYNAPARRIDVVATYGSQSSSISYVYDLKTLLPKQVQVGFSASTGNVIDALFDVFSWSFTSSLVWDGKRVNRHEETYLEETVM